MNWDQELWDRFVMVQESLVEQGEDAGINMILMVDSRLDELMTEIEWLRADLDLIFRDTGGHFCPEWDYLFILPGSQEYDACRCEVGGPRKGGAR